MRLHTISNTHGKLKSFSTFHSIRLEQPSKWVDIQGVQRAIKGSLREKTIALINKI